MSESHSVVMLGLGLAISLGDALRPKQTFCDVLTLEILGSVARGTQRAAGCHHLHLLTPAPSRTRCVVSHQIGRRRQQGILTTLAVVGTLSCTVASDGAGAN